MKGQRGATAKPRDEDVSRTRKHRKEDGLRRREGQSASTPQDDHTQPLCQFDYPTLRKVRKTESNKKSQVIPSRIKAA